MPRNSATKYPTAAIKSDCDTSSCLCHWFYSYSLIPIYESCDEIPTFFVVEGRLSAYMLIFISHRRMHPEVGRWEVLKLLF